MLMKMDQMGYFWTQNQNVLTSHEICMLDFSETVPDGSY